MTKSLAYAIILAWLRSERRKPGSRSKRAPTGGWASLYPSPRRRIPTVNLLVREVVEAVIREPLMCKHKKKAKKKAFSTQA
jgi:hypothetical protein